MEMIKQKNTSSALIYPFQVKIIYSLGLLNGKSLSEKNIELLSLSLDRVFFNIVDIFIMFFKFLAKK